MSSSLAVRVVMHKKKRKHSDVYKLQTKLISRFVTQFLNHNLLANSRSRIGKYILVCQVYF